MGYPRRFLGTGEPCEIDGVVLPARCAVEVTVRTLQQQFLLRPDKQSNQILLGCFGRAYDRYPSMSVAALSALSNHVTFLAMPDSVFVLSSFMRDFLSTLARRLNPERDREGTFWERRYRAIPIADQPALEARFRYVITQGTKENLVWSARDWPGVTSIPALLGGKPLVGRWHDRSAQYDLERQRQRMLERAAARGRTIDVPKVEPVWREYPIPMVPLPHWADLPPGKQRALVADMLADDDRITRERHQRDGTRPLGVRGILAVDPLDRPKRSKRSPAPVCHASSKRTRAAFRQAQRTLASAAKAALPEVVRAASTTAFPRGTSAPSLYFSLATEPSVTSTVVIPAAAATRQRISNRSDLLCTDQNRAGPNSTGPPGT